MIDKNNLPKSWEVIKASGGGDLLRGVNYKKENSSYEAQENYLPVLRANNIQSGELNFNDLVFVDKKHIDEKQLLKKGDIVFAMSSGSKHLVGKSAKAKEDFNGGFGAFCAVFRPNENFNKNFIDYFFKSPYYKKLISAIAKGTNINNLKREHILDLDFPVPPTNEQDRIVTKLEELFSDLDKGIESLEKAQQQLKVYRQAVLKWAFEGKLTNEKNKDGELPKGWQWKKFGEIAEIKRGKSKHRPRNEPSLFVGKYPFIQTGEIRNVNGGTIHSYSQTYSELGLAQSKLWKKGTLCITIAANIGETAFLGIDACFPDSVVGIVSDVKYLLPKYTNFFLISIKSKLEKLAPATAQKNLNVDTLEKINIPLAPLEEQEKIIQEIESRLSVCDKIEETISESLLQAEALRLSIIKKAFEGKLVKQNPKDEPAIKLLERIRAEKMSE